MSALRRRYGPSTGPTGIELEARAIINAMLRQPGRWATVRDAVHAQVPASMGGAIRNQIERAVGRQILAAAREEG